MNYICENCKCRYPWDYDDGGVTYKYKDLEHNESILNKSERKNMKTVRQVVDIRAFEKKYNIEWYTGRGEITTTSAIMTSIENGYIYFRYPSGGIFILQDDAIRSLECLE